MNEQLWLCSDDPVAMMHWLVFGVRKGKTNPGIRLPHANSQDKAPWDAPHLSFPIPWRSFAMLVATVDLVDFAFGGYWKSRTNSEIQQMKRGSALVQLWADNLVPASMVLDNRLTEEEKKENRDWKLYHPLTELCNAYPHPDEAAGDYRFANAEMIREIIGNPFQVLPILPLSTSRYEVVVEQSKFIYHGQDYQELPMIADMLEDLGDSPQYLLDHLHSGKLHVRGCWALDLLTSRR